LDIYQLTQRRCDIPNNTFRDVLIYPHGYPFTKMDQLFLNNVYAAKNKLAFVQWK